MTKSQKFAIIFTVLTAVIIFIFFLNLFIGSVKFSPAEILEALIKNSGDASDIVRKIRFPRVAAALVLGGALSISGYLLQTFFHNPIAGPFVLGVSSGAKLAVAAVLVAVSGYAGTVNSAEMIISAFVGAMLSLGFVLIVSRKTDQMPILIVCGIMIGYICSAITDLIVTFADDSDIVDLHDWSQGTFSGSDTADVRTASILIFCGIIGTFLISKPLTAFMLGEDHAKNLGVNVRLLKAFTVILSGLFSACVTAYAGPVSFVGIAVPHIARMIFKTSRPIIMIPACFLCGGIFCMLCDMIARTLLAPTELSIGTVTSVFGAPIVIWVMLRRRREERI